MTYTIDSFMRFKYLFRNGLIFYLTKTHSHSKRMKGNAYVSFCLQIQELCTNVTSERMICKSPAVQPKSRIVRVWFEMDNVHIDFPTIKNKPFTYHPNPELLQLNSESPGTPIRFKPGGVLAVEVLAFLCDSVLLMVHQWNFSIILRHIYMPQQSITKFCLMTMYQIVGGKYQYFSIEIEIPTNIYSLAYR